MSKALKLIVSIRDTLNDNDGDRWDNNRLMRAINEAMADINLKARLLRDKMSFDILGGVHTYRLDNSVQSLTRCVYRGKPIPFKTHEEMDLMSSTWEEDTGDVIEYIIYDRLNRGQIRLYPAPISSIDEVTPEYGVITDISGFTANSPYGVLIDINEPLEGIILYYIRKPTEITGTNDEIDLNDVWDKAIKHYVCGYTLRDDKSTQDRAFGNEELQLYNIELLEAGANSSENFTPSAPLETQYRKL